MIRLGDRAYRVVSGAYAVFIVSSAGGRRRPLTRVKAGETVEGAALSGWHLVAVPLEPSELAPIDAAGPGWWARVAAHVGVEPAEPSAIGAALGRWLESTEASEATARERRDEARAHRTTERLRGLARDFAALAEPAHAPSLDTDDPFLLVARTVARAQGFDVVAPPRAQGSTELRIQAVARASRCRARRVDLVGTWWKTEGPPLIGTRRDDGSPIAIVRDRGGRYAVVGPDGKLARVTAETHGVLAPEAWMLMRPLPEGRTGLVELLKFSLRGTRPEIVRAILWGACITLVGLATPAATGLVVDTLVPDADRGGLMVVGLSLLALAVGSTSFQLAQAVALLRLDVGVEVSAQSALWDRLLRLEPSFFRSYTSGDLLQRVNAASAVGQRLTGLTLKTLLSSGLTLLNAVVLYLYSPKLTVVAALVALVVVVTTTLPAVSTVQQAQRIVTLRGRLFGALVGLVEGVSKLRAAGAEDRGFAHWARLYRAQLEAQSEAWRQEDRLAVLGVALPSAATLVLFAFAGPLATPTIPGEQPLRAGEFIGFFGTFGQFLGALVGLAGTVLSVVHVRAEAARARPILEATPEVVGGSVDPGPLAGGIVLDRLLFRYRADGPPVLDQLSLTVRPGEYVAIVGASGCGKSTLLRMILGFETPESGRVLYDGQDLSGLDREAVRRQIGVVLQSGRLMPGSLFDNIAGAKRVGLDAAWKALRLAGLEEEVRKMPMGLHTVVGAEGVLSGGQRQRLLIARALVGDPKILLLDEATSALDNRSQATVSENLEALDLTRIAIAHRLSTVRSADRIVVIDAGRVVQQGSFDELMAVDGHFKRLAERQLG